MADLVVIAILCLIGYWAVKQLRSKGTGCCGKGGSCSACHKSSCKSCAEKK